jgi:hypothetical protein
LRAGAARFAFFAFVFDFFARFFAMIDLRSLRLKFRYSQVRLHEDVYNKLQNVDLFCTR